MDELESLLKMEDGDAIYLNWFEGGGAEVIKVGMCWHLYYINPYGGIPILHDTYTEEDLLELIGVTNSWT